MSIHPTAIVEAGAQLGERVEIGPYVFVGPEVIIEDDTVVQSHAILKGNVRLGARNLIGHVLPLIGRCGPRVIDGCIAWSGLPTGSLSPP